MEWTTGMKADIAMGVAILILILILITYISLYRESRGPSLREMKRKDYKRIAMLYGLKPRWWWTEKRTRRELDEIIKINREVGKPAGRA